MPSRSNKRSKRKTKARKSSGRKGRRCGMWGGSAPAGYSPGDLSLAQGEQFLDAHVRQHGGAYTPLGGAPVGDQGLLPQELHSMARIIPSLRSMNEIVAMRDPDQVQAGGRRRSVSRGPTRNRNRSNRNRSNKNRSSKNRSKKNRSKKNRNTRNKRASKNNRKSRKNRKNRKQSGGNCRMGSPYPSPSSLLESPSQNGGRRRKQAGGRLEGSPVDWDGGLISQEDAARAGLPPFEGAASGGQGN